MRNRSAFYRNQGAWIGLSIAFAALTLSHPANADTFKPAVTTAGQIFEDIAVLINKAVAACKIANPTGLAPNETNGAELGKGLKCPGTRPPDTVTDLDPVTCTFKAELKVKGGVSLTGWGNAETKDTVAVTADLMSTSNQRLTHSHQTTVSDPNTAATCPETYYDFVTVMTINVKAKVTIVVKVMGSFVTIEGDVSGAVGGGTSGRRFAGDPVTHDSPRDCSEES